MRFLFSIAIVLFGLVAGASAQTTDIAAYFPIRQGDAWTYDWQLRLGQAPPQTVKRTRAFEGREFVNTGNVDKLASENGDYALFSLDERGLLLHGAAEYGRDVRFIFDPPALTCESDPLSIWLPRAMRVIFGVLRQPLQFCSVR